MPKTKDPALELLAEKAKSAAWKVANYKKTFGKFPGSYAKIMAILTDADDNETEQDVEDNLVGWWADDIKASKQGLEFEFDVGPHIRRFKYSAKSKKWTSLKVSFFDKDEPDYSAEFDDDEFDGLGSLETLV